MYLNQLQTMSNVFVEICQGERPWTALGNFMNYWYEYARDRREALVIDPLPTYDEQCQELHQWAVFCAAAVEWFCHNYSVECPAWVQNPKYILTAPWFFRDREEAKARLLATTPEEFKRRNIFCGNRCFLNKWEWIEQLQQQVVLQKILSTWQHS